MRPGGDAAAVGGGPCYPARRIGDAIRALGVPVAKVLSSEYCRAWETARLLDLGPVTRTRAPRAGSEPGFELVALLTPDDWMRLAELMGEDD